MEHIKKFKTQNEFLNEKPNLPYPCVSFVEETQNVEYEKQSIITAKYRITQDVIDECVNYGIIPFFQGQGLLNSYTINGKKIGPFEEPKYEIVEKQVNYESLPYKDPFIALEDCTQLGAGNFNTAMTWSTEGEIDIENDTIIKIVYINGEINDKEHLSISDLTTNSGFTFSEDNKSFSLTQDACEQYNNSSFVQEEFGEGSVVYIGFAYERAKDVKYTNLGYECSTKTTFTNGEEQKEITLINDLTYVISKDSCTEGGKGLFNTEMTWTIDRQIVSDNDFICLFRTYIELGDEMYEPECIPLQYFIDEMITIHEDNKSFSLTQDFCDSLNSSDSEGIFIGLSIVESDCVSEDGLITLQPSTVTTFKVAELSNEDKVSPNMITVPCTQDELNKEYEVKYILTKSARSIGLYERTPLYEIDLSKLDENREFIIDRYAFSYTKLKSIDIPNYINKMGHSAFKRCYDLQSINLSNSINSIDIETFYYCSGLTSIVIPDSVTSIGSSAFTYCSGLTSVTIGSGVTSIGRQAFEKCKFTEIKLPNSINYIGASAFTYCSRLTEIVIPDLVTNINDELFYGCSNLKSVILGKGVTKMGVFVFKAAAQLSSITCYSIIAPTFSYDTFADIKTYGTLYYPQGSDYSTWIGGNYGSYGNNNRNLGYYRWTSKTIQVPN